MQRIENNEVGFGNGFIYMIAADIRDCWDPDVRFIAAYQDEGQAREHLDKLNEFGKKLNSEMSKTWDHVASFNPYDPGYCNSETSPDYHLVAIPLADLESLKKMHQRAKEDLTVRCLRCGKVSGERYPHTHKSYIRRFGTYNEKKAGFVCSECEWYDKMEEEQKRYAKS